MTGRVQLKTLLYHTLFDQLLLQSNKDIIQMDEKEELQRKAELEEI